MFTTSSTSALSAKQGKILNDNKAFMQVFNDTSINLKITGSYPVIIVGKSGTNGTISFFGVVTRTGLDSGSGFDSYFIKGSPTVTYASGIITVAFGSRQVGFVMSGIPFTIE